jgi:hypothetical protein
LYAVNLLEYALGINICGKKEMETGQREKWGFRRVVTKAQQPF